MEAVEKFSRSDAPFSRYEFLKINSERGCAFDVEFLELAVCGRTVYPITAGPSPSERARRAASNDTGFVIIRDRKIIWIEKIPWGLDAMG
ncbi:hypothetical protein OUZ56_017548 [Daphnia magna]|uniref:Uncharacterized protein n=1 Tax=Daphnia magna TaxID=35525 RepID=A0ABR0AT17_9CRUS|nr:hypothetical protein OUZ56_017548 [Daphnia magna]